MGKNVELYARKGYGRLILGKWVHIGNGNALRAHEGTLRIGDKCVFGKDNTVNTYLDIEFGAATIVADWVYVCDFDHVFTNISMPIKDQGITKSPVRIGPDCWLGTKVTVLRGTTVGRGSVVAAHCLINDDVPPYSVAVGVPVRVVRNRLEDARVRAEQEARWAEEGRQAALRKQAEQDRRTAATAEAAARSAGITAPVDPSEHSDLPMTPAEPHREPAPTGDPEQALESLELDPMREHADQPADAARPEGSPGRATVRP
jgi:acetyltransferase-like isoleucine patch superfamily enzyme